MAFTRAWDETFPPDTQLANLLGLDIRQFKEDTRERLRDFGAGDIADRPTPEAVFGNANTGVTYYSVDENKLYRWNGTSWVDATQLSRFFIDFATVAIPGGGGDGNSVILPANTLVANDIVKINARFIGSTGSGNADLFFGSERLIRLTSVNSVVYFSSIVYVVSASVQRDQTFARANVAGSLIDAHAITEDTTLAITIKTFNSNLATADMLIVEVIRP